MTRLRQQHGFTLVELLAVMLIGGIVLAGVASLMQVVLRQSTAIIGRTDASQRGRLVMDQMTRDLRSQVCIDLGQPSAKPALVAADRNSVTFHADLSDGTRTPVKRQISYEAANLRIVQRDYPATSLLGAVPTVFSGTPQERTLLQNVTAPGGVGDFFSFRKYTGSGLYATDTVVVPGATALNGADLASVARITVAMDVRPGNADNGKIVTQLQDSVLVRNLSSDYDPANPKALRCQ